MFFCSSSHNLRRCSEGCCGKCNSEQMSDEESDETNSLITTTTDSDTGKSNNTSQDLQSDHLNDISF